MPEENRPIGKFGRLHREFLKEKYPARYSELILSCELWSYLADVHRDYSIHTEGMPIQIRMYDDRMEIHNPGGIYGRMKIDQLGKVQPDTRNSVLASALETLGLTENRYSGIPTIRREMQQYSLKEAVLLYVSVKKITVNHLFL